MISTNKHSTEYYSDIKELTREEHLTCLEVSYKILNHLQKLINSSVKGSREYLHHLNKKTVLLGIINAHEQSITNQITPGNQIISA